jgi:S1-C subfamily serine protease
VVGAGVALGTVAATGNLGGGGTTTVVRDVAAPAPASAPAATSPEPTAFVPTGGRSVQQIVRQATPGIVVVTVNTPGGQALGTGFVIDHRGHILTNAHVVDGASSAKVTFSNGDVEQAAILGRDNTIDLAVLKIDPAKAGHPLALGTSAGLVVGDPVVAIGNPLGYEFTVTTGIVSGLKRDISSPNDSPIQNAIQTDAAITHGNSGGPLLDAVGSVVGINSQIASETGGNEGIGFAVPIDTVRPVADSIIRTGKAQHAWLGIEGQALSPDGAAKLKLPVSAGVGIVRVFKGSPAASAGLRAATSSPGGLPHGGDVIVAVDGHPTRDMGDVSEQVASRPVGASVTVSVLRSGHRVTLDLRLGNRPSGLK